MSTVSTPPSSYKHTSYLPVFDDDSHTEDLPQPHPGAQSINRSHSSSPEPRPVDVQSPIPEEEEDETSSEAANEPLTPTDSHQPAFQDKMSGQAHVDQGYNVAVRAQPPPLLLNTPATPPRSAGKDRPAEQPKTPLQKKPQASKEPGSGIKRAMSGFFKRSNSHGSTTNLQPLSSSVPSGSDHILAAREHHRMSTRRLSTTASPMTTRSNTPPSPGSPAEPQDERRPPNVEIQEPSSDDFFSHKKNRSSTGFSFRDRFKHKSYAVQVEKENDTHRQRATSVDLDGLPQDQSRSRPNSDVPHISRQVWGMAAETGSGLKSRRMSLHLPHDITVDVVELYSEYSDQSKLIGRRGKSIGKGATANVKLMSRKGGPTGEFFAVKEFRGKSSNENAEDYEKKVKSEFSIARSVHHPNIVETFRLCTHNHRWNHVMEFCENGDLFSLVNQKYLARDDHLNDRLCLFKQLIQGLNYLHNNGIAHRDVKLENLLITKDSKLKITDFGVSEVFSGLHPGMMAADGQCGKEMYEIRLCAPGICGSPPYIAPEVVAKTGEYDPRPLDVWGAAIVMLCMCASGCLWEKAVAGSSQSYDDLLNGWNKWNSKHPENTPISESDYPHVSFFDRQINPPALRRMLLTMLNPDPEKRVTMAAVAKNRWLKNVDCCQADSYGDPATVIDASKYNSCKMAKNMVVQHNHLPPTTHVGHKLVRLP
jgi:protein-serine/threonine kinase